MIYYSTSKSIDFNRLIEMFDEVGWTDKTQEMARLKEMIGNSQIVVSAWDNGYMVGFVRCITDFVFNGQINNLVVDSKYRDKGIGKELVKRIIESNPKVTFLLRGDTENQAFYRGLGFEIAQMALVYKRKQ